MMQSHQSVQLSKSMPKRAAYKAGIIWAQATIPNPEISSLADRMESHGGYVGQHFLQLQRAVRSWPNVHARKAATAGANASAQDSPVLHSAAACVSCSDAESYWTW